MNLLEELKILNNKYDLHKSEVNRHFKAANKALKDKNKIIYDWVAKKHPSWIKQSTIKYDLDNDNNTEYDGITLRILNDGKEAWIGIEYYIPDLPCEVQEDTYWKTRKVKIEDLK